MRSVQSSVAKAKLTELLTAVERGETIAITRHGRTIARLVPDGDRKQAAIKKAMDDLADFRATMPALSLNDMLSARHEGYHR